MQGIYENVKIIGIFCRYGIQQSVDNNGTFYYRPIVYMRNCKNLNNIDLKLPEYLLFNLTKGFKGLGVLNPGTKLEIHCRRYLKEKRILHAFPDDPNVLEVFIMFKNQVNPEAENDPINTDLVEIYKNWLKSKA